MPRPLLFFMSFLLIFSSLHPFDNPASQFISASPVAGSLKTFVECHPLFGYPSTEKMSYLPASYRQGFLEIPIQDLKPASIPSIPLNARYKIKVNTPS